MSLRIAIAGKGGVGKSTLAALVIRALRARRLKPILAVDADPNSCLPEKLAVRQDRTIGELREALRAEPDKVPAGIAKTEWIERLINQEVTEAVGFDLVVMGRQEGPECYCYINNLLRNCLDRIGGQYRAVVIDNEAGLEHLSRRSNGAVDVMLVVAQPTLVGARTAGRIAAIIDALKLNVRRRYLVLNACDGALDAARATAFAQTGIPVLGWIPTDPAVQAAELACASLLDLPDDAPAVRAVDALVECMLKEDA